LALNRTLNTKLGAIGSEDDDEEGDEDEDEDEDDDEEDEEVKPQTANLELLTTNPVF